MQYRQRVVKAGVKRPEARLEEDVEALMAVTKMVRILLSANPPPPPPPIPPYPLP